MMENRKEFTPPALKEIKKHKMPMMMLPPPPNLMRKPQPIQSVAPLVPAAQNNMTLNAKIISLDLSMHPRRSVPTMPNLKEQPPNLQDQNSSESQCETIQLSVDEVHILNYLRTEKVSTSELMEWLESRSESDSNNNQVEPTPIEPVHVKNTNYPMVSESVIQDVLAVSQKNKQLLQQAFKDNLENAKPKLVDKESQCSIIGDSFQYIFRSVQEISKFKEDIITNIKEYAKKQIDEKCAIYFSQKSAQKAGEPPTKKSKTSQPSNSQIKVVGSEIVQEPERLQESWDLATQRMQQYKLKQGARSVSAPGVIAPPEEARPQLFQQQYCTKTYASRQQQHAQQQLQQNSQEPCQENQQGEWNWGPAPGPQTQWHVDPRVRMRMMRVNQQQAPANPMPNTVWGQSFSNAHGQGQF